MAAGGQPGMRARFAAKGILIPDDFVYDVKYDGPEVKAQWMKRLAELKPGVTEIFIHAGRPTEELRRSPGAGPCGPAEFDTFAPDPEIPSAAAGQGIRRVGYRAIRDLNETADQQRENEFREGF